MQHVVVAATMACFMELLLLLCFRTSLARGMEPSEPSELPGPGDAGVPGIANMLELFESSVSSFEASGKFHPSSYIDAVVRVLSQQPDIAFWASPPIGCCFALCPRAPLGRPQRASARLVALLRRAVVVYALGAVLGPLSELWIEGVPGMAAHQPAAHQLAAAVETAITLLALYALFITYRLSKVPLHGYRTTLKFLAVKLLVFIAPAQRHALSHFLGPAVGEWASHVATVVETPMLALLLWRAFPASELPDRSTIAQQLAGMLPASDDEEAGLMVTAPDGERFQLRTS